MVFFTCSGCGESLKKNKVEKHFAICRSCDYLTCIDCSKDFYDEEYDSHTSCISELEKYSAKGTNIKPGKGEVKQQQWMKHIDEAITTSNSVGLNKKVADILTSLKDYQNVPRKKPKFFNFLKNSLRIRDVNLGEEIWKIFSSFNEKNREVTTNMSEENDQTSMTGIEIAKEKSTSKAKKKSRDRKENTNNEGMDENKETTDLNGEAKKKSKKKGKKSRKSEDNGKEERKEQNMEEGSVEKSEVDKKDATVNGQGNKKGKKAKKSKKHDDQDGLKMEESKVERELPISTENTDSEKKSKKNKKKKLDAGGVEDQNVAVKEEDDVQKSKAIDDLDTRDVEEVNGASEKRRKNKKSKKTKMDETQEDHKKVTETEDVKNQDEDSKKNLKPEEGEDIKQGASTKNGEEDSKTEVDRKESENLPEKEAKIESNNEFNKTVVDVAPEDTNELSSNSEISSRKKKKRKMDGDDTEAKKKRNCDSPDAEITFDENNNEVKGDSKAADSDKKKKSKKRKKDALLNTSQEADNDIKDAADDVPAVKKTKSGMQEEVKDILSQDKDSSVLGGALASSDKDAPKKNKTGKMKEASSENETDSQDPVQKPTDKNDVGKFKWVKTIKKALAKTPNNSMSKKKLRKTVLKEYQKVADDSEMARQRFDSKFSKLLSESAKFIVENDTVKLTE